MEEKVLYPLYGICNKKGVHTYPELFHVKIFGIESQNKVHSKDKANFLS